MHYTDVRPFAARVVGYAEGKRPVPPQGIRLGADGIELPTRTTWSSGTNDTVELQAHGRAGADGYQARTLTRESVAVVDVDEEGREELRVVDARGLLAARGCSPIRTPRATRLPLATGATGPQRLTRERSAEGDATSDLALDYRCQGRSRRAIGVVGLSTVPSRPKCWIQTNVDARHPEASSSMASHIWRWPKPSPVDDEEDR